ncbi:hypothetical protein QR685DRAFT_529187 [Neurospora intermedia]|uniref:Uncharacterized protein n=1 Tax=Neurospora intermedia TaxID=5142 RepID=A0ABR3D8A9_NEUIN
MDRPLGADHVVMATAGLKATPTRGKYLYSTVLDSLDMVYKCVNDCMPCCVLTALFRSVPSWFVL